MSAWRSELAQLTAAGIEPKTLVALSLQGSSTVERRLVKPKDEGSTPSPAADEVA